MENNRPVHCASCGAVLFKRGGDKHVDLASALAPITIRCRCGRDNEVSLEEVWTIKVQIVPKAGEFDRFMGKSPLDCSIPPAGWYCTRKLGHDGPCAARPLDATLTPPALVL